jgi:hypothetical protein
LAAIGMENRQNRRPRRAIGSLDPGLQRVRTALTEIESLWHIATPCESDFAIVHDTAIGRHCSLEVFMSTRSVLLMCAIGCAGAGGVAEGAISVVAETGEIDFHCLNHTSIHVVTCQGSISLFPITITIENIRILSDNELRILSDDLNDVSLIDGGVVDHSQILDDVETQVLDDLVDEFAITVTRTEIFVCAVASGTQVCT